jgi:hypothetical protein
MFENANRNRRRNLGSALSTRGEDERGGDAGMAEA